jgi:hypothetical protein
MASSLSLRMASSLSPKNRENIYFLKSKIHSLLQLLFESLRVFIKSKATSRFQGGPVILAHLVFAAW